jgi:hypothetical protein
LIEAHGKGFDEVRQHLGGRRIDALPSNYKAKRDEQDSAQPLTKDQTTGCTQYSKQAAVAAKLNKYHQSRDPQER